MFDDDAKSSDMFFYHSSLHRSDSEELEFEEYNKRQIGADLPPIKTADDNEVSEVIDD